MQLAPSGIKAIRQELSVPADPVRIKADTSKSLTDWEKELQQAVADANAAQQNLNDLEAEDTKRSSLRSQLPDLLSAAKTRQTELSEILSARAGRSDPSKENPLLAQSARWVLQSEQSMTAAAVTYYEGQLRDNEIYREWLAARRDRAARNLSAANTLANALQDQIDQQRQLESEKAAAQAVEAREAAAQLHPSVKAIADRNAALAA